MPKVNPKDTQSSWMKKCVPVVLDEGTAGSQKQAVAICLSMWRDRHKKKKSSAEVLEEVLRNMKVD